MLQRARAAGRPKTPSPALIGDLQGSLELDRGRLSVMHASTTTRVDCAALMGRAQVRAAQLEGWICWPGCLGTTLARPARATACPPLAALTLARRSLAAGAWHHRRSLGSPPPAPLLPCSRALGPTGRVPPGVGWRPPHRPRPAGWRVWRWRRPTPSWE